MTPAAKVSLCVEVTRSQSSSMRGASVHWVISAWTTGGNVPDSTVRLQATPGSLTPEFSFGCGSNDGTASCDLGAMDAKSAKRQLQAQVTVPAASTVKSVALMATGSAAHLPRDPVASAAVTITAAATTTTPLAGITTAPLPGITTAPLPVTNLPGIPAAGPTLSPGGSAAGLFPTLQPSQAQGQGRNGRSGKLGARPVADTAALPEGAPVAAAQLVGLAALALAFVLAVTRLSIRRRPVPSQPTPPKPAEAKAETEQAEAPDGNR